ncbi:MAG TPA: sulfite exporter TauE/SafE family protein [Propionibacteriaceae bacterium]
MRKLIVLAVVGLAAQLVDGSLGMGYGVTSSTLLVVLAGLTPAAASASVHFSELGTNLASGVSHWKLKNVDWRVVGRIAGPGAVGAFLGATVLSKLSTEAAAPVMAIILALLGLYIITRFIVGIRPRIKRQLTIKFLAPLGIFAGFIDATGGGGWGPVATPALLADGRMEPRKVIGSIDTAEFAVSAAASLGFLIGLGAAGINWGFALALLVGGLIAAPLAAYLVKVAPTHLLGVAVGGMILLTNSRTLLKTADAPDPARFAVYGAILVLTIVGLYVAQLRARRRNAAAALESESVSA